MRICIKIENTYHGVVSYYYLLDISWTTDVLGFSSLISSSNQALMNQFRIGKYQHYKWNFYEVLWIAHHSETLEELVVYRALYNSEEFWDDVLWVRPKKMFLENIEFNGELQPRFRYVPEN